MQHRITMKNTQTDWNEALPQGNGVFGGMSYFRHNQLTCAMNHYEIYYTMYQRYSHAYQEKLKAGELTFGESRTYEELLKAAKESIRDLEKEQYFRYQRIIWPQTEAHRRGKVKDGTSHPPTGEILTDFADCLAKPEESCLELDIENAVMTLDLKNEADTLHLEQRVLSDADAVLTEFNQSREGLVKTVTIRYPQRRNHVTAGVQPDGSVVKNGFTYEFEAKDASTFHYTVTFYPGGEDIERFEPFKFSGCVKLVGAQATAEVKDNEMVLTLTEADKEFSMVYAVYSQLSGSRTQSGAINLAQKTADHIKSLKKAHARHWDAFFGKSAIHIPDKFAETLWYYNLYLLACCSGLGGKRAEQACGLNGLWDIKQPTIWGSLWYWDVNIEAAFWPVYTSNHMELAEVFNNGLLSFLDNAKARAKNFYHMPGAAMDYPHVFYNCMWPWCAQFVWWYYEYTLDKSFLKHKGYPLFVDILQFAKAFSTEDENGKVVIFPDVSPEQGPLTRNSVITISTLKYLCVAALKAARILEIPEADTAWIKDFLDRMPDYPVAEYQNYGKIFKDSELAPAGINLRHPSLLMPIFPAGEIGLDSSPEERALAERTLNFVEDHTELGVFGFGWFSSAASRLGKGDTALRLLYEKGWDLILRDNGMGAEETERFINHCLTHHFPLYYPHMMESIGEGANAINEMLLQSYNGIIRVFPAVPTGKETDYMHYAGKVTVATDTEVEYAPWESASFEGLLAKGGFEVSARREKGRTVSIRIESKFGNFCRIALDCLPEEYEVVSEDGQRLFASEADGVLSFPMDAGEVCLILGTADASDKTDSAEIETPLVHVSHTNRRIFVGKDSDTDYLKAVDSFLWDYYLANDRRRRMTPYIFTFGCNVDPCEEIPLRHGEASGVDNEIAFQGIPITEESRYTTTIGYGFRREDTLVGTDCKAIDSLRRDSLTSQKEARFMMELPKGRYDILVVCGNGSEDSDTVLTSPQGVFAPVICTLKAGDFKAVTLPIVWEEDGILELAFTTDSTWSVSAVMLNKDFAN